MSTILLVDDDADFIELNRHVLASAGYEVVTAANRQEALTALTRQPIDLVITDLMMGELNSGFSLAAEIRKLPAPPGRERSRPTPVIMTTSVTRVTGLDFRPKDADDLAKMNVDAYFEKPVRPQTLLAKVADLLAPNC